MRGFGLMLFCLLFLSPVAQGKTYSCRDSRGQLHFSDNLQQLPQECRGKETVVPQAKTDKLQFVPDKPIPPAERRRFEQSVKEVERALQRRKAETQQMQQKAEGLQQRYRQLMEQMSRARRIWDNSSRQELKQLKKDRLELYAEKRTLLDELNGLRLRQDEVDAVKATLREITAE